MASSQRLLNKVAIVTGASSGLGRAIALAYAREGALLVCADLQATSRSETAEESKTNTDELVRQTGGKAIFVQTDVGNSASVEALVKAAVDEYGRLDV